MGVANTNSTGFNAARETTPGTAGTSWTQIEVNQPSKVGGDVEQIERRPITTDRQAREGSTVGKSSSFGYTADLTMSHLEEYIEAAMFADFTHPGGTGLAVFDPTAVVGAVAASNVLTTGGNVTEDETVTIGSTVYTFKAAPSAAFEVDIGGTETISLANLASAINLDGTAGVEYGASHVAAHPDFTATSDATTLTITAIVAGTAANGETLASDAGSWDQATTTGGTDGAFTVASLGAMPPLTLVYARNYTAAANNGLFVTGTNTGTSIIPTSPLTADGAPVATASVEFAGFQGASGDFEIDANGDLICTAADFTDWDVVAGMAIKIGGAATVTRFATAANNDYAVIETVAAKKLTLEKQGGTFVTDAGTSKTIQVFTGRFVKQRDVAHADFLERTYTMEVGMINLAPGPATHYLYASGQRVNTMSISMSPKGKAEVTMEFIGTDTGIPTTSRLTGASAALAPGKTKLLNTATDMGRLRIAQQDTSALTTDFLSMTLAINNNITPKDVLGTLGPAYVFYGDGLVTADSKLYFTDVTLASMVTSSTAATVDFVLSNTDGAAFFDIPSCTLGTGTYGFPTNEGVEFDTTIKGWKDAAAGTSLQVTLFAHVPA